MELKEMSIEQLEERKTAIVAELDNPEADLDALEEEMRSIKAELENRKAEEAKKAEIRKQVAEGEGEVKESVPTEERKLPTMEEIRVLADEAETLLPDGLLPYPSYEEVLFSKITLLPDNSRTSSRSLLPDRYSAPP